MGFFIFLIVAIFVTLSAEAHSDPDLEIVAGEELQTDLPTLPEVNSSESDLVTAATDHLKARLNGKIKVSPKNVFSLSLRGSQYPPPVRERLEAFLQEVAQSFPPEFRNRLRTEIRVVFSNMLDKNKGPIPAPSCSGKNSEESHPVLGYALEANPPTILLNQKLVEEILKGEAGSRKRNCGHGNFYRLAKATLIHEISHLYDYAKLNPAGGKLTVSDQSDFLHLAGWTERGLLRTTREQGNLATDRSPDPYEFFNSEETFAVNMEFFLLDPEFACRRPALHLYFREHFQHDPFPNRACKTNDTVLLQTQGAATGNITSKQLDPARVYQVHYLLADRGNEASSRWGHAMYRVIVCAPERTVVGPDCLKDVKHHIVISFRATPTDLNIDLVSGIVGDYPSRMFLFPLSQIIQEYTIGELRDLKSMPLRLTEAQKELFLRRSQEIFWAYRGKYMFFSNNCATESLNLLRGILPERAFRQKTTVRAPTTLAKVLATSGMIDVPFGDKQELIRAGNLFPSARQRLQDSFEWLARIEVAPRPTPRAAKTMAVFLNTSNADTRKQWLESLLQKVAAKDRRKAAAHFFVIETYFEARLMGRMEKAATKILLDDPTRLGLTEEFAAKLRESVLGIARFDPAEGLKIGYGIPLAHELGKNQNPTNSSQEQLKEFQEAITSGVQRVFQSGIAEMEKISANKRAIVAAMKAAN